MAWFDLNAGGSVPIGGTNPANLNFKLKPVAPPRRYYIRNPRGKWVEVNETTYLHYRCTYDAYREDPDDCVARMAMAMVEVLPAS